MRIDETPSGLKIDLTGVVTLSAAAELHSIVCSALAAAKPVVVSLSETERIDSSALQILWALAAELKRNGTPLRIEGAPPSVVDYAKLAGLSQVFESPSSSNVSSS